jgi:hypothetical protein
MTKRSEFTTLTKLKAMARYIRCPGVPELGIKCGKKFGSLAEIEFDHLKRCEIDPDNSPENCSPKCKDCHRAKTIKKDAFEAKKGRRIRRETKQSQKPKAKIQNGLKLPGSKASNWRHRMDGTWERRS